MSCFWRSLINAFNDRDVLKYLKEEDKKFFLKIKKCKTKDCVKLIEKIKIKNTKTHNVSWNDEKLSDKLLNDNQNAIIELNKKNVDHGYYCSTCDPVLLLISELYKVNIYHDYNDHMIKYKHHSKPSARLTLKSNTHHMWT